jgi:lactoylglutathione lyase
MEYASTNLIVHDVKQATAFYVQAFGFTLDHAHENWDYAELRTGRTRIGLVATSLAEEHVPIALRVNVPTEPPAGVELNFVTDDVDAAFQKAVEGGAAIVVPPTEKPWGRAAYVRDPQGVLIHLAIR